MQNLVDAAADRALVRPARSAHNVVKVVEHVAVDQQLVVLKHDAHAAAQMRYLATPYAAQVEPDDFGVAAAQIDLGIERFEQRALAAADTAYKVDELAGIDTQIDIRQNELVAHVVAARAASVAMEYRYVSQIYDACTIHNGNDNISAKVIIIFALDKKSLHLHDS